MDSPPEAFPCPVVRRRVGRKFLKLGPKPAPRPGLFGQGHAALQEIVPSGTTFRTRGLIFASQHVRAVLWVPRTPATDSVRFHLRNLPERKPFWSTTHIDLTASWEKDGAPPVPKGCGSPKP